MYNSRLGRRTRRISDSKPSPKLRDRRFIDEDDDNEDEVVELGDMKLTPEEVQGLLELLPYKEALIKIAKGEFEIEKVEEAEEDVEGDESEAEAGAEDDLDNFEEDENLAGDEGSESEDEDEEDYEDFEEEEESDAVEDSAVNDAWRKRLAGNNK